MQLSLKMIGFNGFWMFSACFVFQHLVKMKFFFYC